jgi:hypothetical protein
MTDTIKIHSKQEAYEQGMLAEMKGDHQTAFQLYNVSLSLGSNQVHVMKRLAGLYSAHLQWDKAIEILRECTERKPDDAESWWRLGACLEYIGETEQSQYPILRGVTLAKGSPGAHVNYAHWLLKTGAWTAGFTELQWAFVDGQRRQRFFTPMWEGNRYDKLPDTLWVWCEQGFGDTLMFARLIPYLANIYESMKIIFEVPYQLEPLISAQKWKNVTVIASPIERDVPEHDAHIGLLCLPRVLGITPERIPYSYMIPMVVPVESKKKFMEDERLYPPLKEGWTRRIPKVGICWQGNPGHANDRNRSCKLEQFRDILSTPGIDFFSLQIGGKEIPDDVKNEYPELCFFGEEVESFLDTAAIISQLDLVITVDTSVAHVAGCIGVPCWILLSKASDWRWLMDREDSVFYSSVRLFRQESIGEWQPVFHRIEEELRCLS